MNETSRLFHHLKLGVLPLFNSSQSYVCDMGGVQVIPVAGVLVLTHIDRLLHVFLTYFLVHYPQGME